MGSSTLYYIIIPFINFCFFCSIFVKDVAHCTMQMHPQSQCSLGNPWSVDVPDNPKGTPVYSIGMGEGVCWGVFWREKDTTDLGALGEKLQLFNVSDKPGVMVVTCGWGMSWGWVILPTPKPNLATYISIPMYILSSRPRMVSTTQSV
jgi:hypothetical protein